MAIISLDCPHNGCRLEKAAFVVKAANEAATGIYECFARCPGCHRSVIAVLHGAGRFDVVNFDGDVEQKMPGGVHTVYPAQPKPGAPGNTPENTALFYEQAFDSLKRGNWDAAGMMFRKTLETALKSLHPDGKGNLKHRIVNLPNEIGVTPAMKEWAQEIREIGNEAAHDEPETEEDAQAVYNFTSMFLRYAYTMPGMLDERRGKTETPENE